nr:ecotropic viral integration site 5 ortholog [Nothobranchius furzeri]
MSKLSSEAQGNPSEEDSSASDAGSEVSLEPETDRFGFILTNGSTAGSVGPSPELVRQREAKWINIIGQWNRILLRKSSTVKLQCQKGIPASLRAKCWPLLCGATGRMRQNTILYETLDSQPGMQSWVDIIERDLDRQFPFHEMFLSKDGHGQRGLFRVLKAYTQFQPEEGYCQAQGPVAAVLLMNMPAEEAFWCLVQISEQFLPGYYSPLLEGVLFDAAILTWVLKKTCPAAHKHLQQHGVEPLMFATDWLMCLFTRHLPFNTLLRVWDLFFCYGVRVLLQVAVVLVRRVLGRTEQRKQCQGQMETLERLRGVKEQVQDEDDAFIAEVCSVPLSKKDLERRTEKELQKWRKDKPTSTFDPRGRCHSYRMVWVRARHDEEEREKKERERGNLSVPLARSASTLSLSPSLLHKRWKKGGKIKNGDSKKSRKVVRHLSMGAKEDWISWADLDFRKEQDVQEEEDVQEGHKTKDEFRLTEDKKPEEHLDEPKAKNTPTEHKEMTVVVKESMETQEGNASIKEEEQLKEESDSRTGQREDSPANHQTDESTLQLPEASSNCEQEEKLEDQSQTLEEQSHVQDNEATDANRGTESPKHACVVEDNSAEGAELRDSREEPEEGAEPENTAGARTDTVKEVPEPGSETPLVPEQEPKEDVQQDQEQVITETKVEKYQSAESLLETENEESHTQTETDVENVAVQDEITQTDPECTETEETSLPECVQLNRDTDIITDTPAGAEEAAAPEPEQEAGGADASGPTETCSEYRRLDQINADDTQTTVHTNEETDACVLPGEKEETAQEEVLKDIPELGQSSEQTPEHSESQVPTVVGSTGHVAEDTQGEDIFTSVEEEPVTDSSTITQVPESQRTKAEHNHQQQTSGRRSSRSSADFCVRKSSSSKFTRRLSEDLFISPEKLGQLAPNHPVEQPKEVDTSQTCPKGTVDVPTQQDSSKRFGLFRKLKGDQPRTAKEKKKPKMQIPKILIQDFGDVVGTEKPAEEGAEEKLSSRERRRRRREQERIEKEEKVKKKKEKELERERRKPQSRVKSFQEQKKKAGDDGAHPAKMEPQTRRFSAAYDQSYF